MNERNIPELKRSTIQKIAKAVIETGIKNNWTTDIISKAIANEVMILAINTNLVVTEK